MIQGASYFFLAILSAAIILAILIFLPFLSPLVLAGALAVIFHPLHRRIVRLMGARHRPSLSALVTLVIVAAIIFVPLTFLAIRISVEARDIYVALAADPTASGSPMLMKLQHWFGSVDLIDMLRTVTQWAFTNIEAIFTKVSRIVIEAIVMLLALFYLLRDGTGLKLKLMNLSPLGDVEDAFIIAKLETAIRSIFAGSIAVGAIQGFLSGIGFAIFGVPNPVLWGLVASLAALVPGIGTALVLIPAIAYLFFIGHTGMAIGLLVWGVVAVGLIDNFLGPILMQRGVKIHPFLILLSVLGGISFFGPIGFVLGPLIIALLFALLEIYKNLRKKSV